MMTTHIAVSTISRDGGLMKGLYRYVELHILTSSKQTCTVGEVEALSPNPAGQGQSIGWVCWVFTQLGSPLE